MSRALKIINPALEAFSDSVNRDAEAGEALDMAAS
jgi:hypothetical protein